MLNKHIFLVTWWKAYSCVVNVLLFFVFSLSLKITSVHRYHLLGTNSSALMNVNCNCDTFIEHMHGIHLIFRCTYKLIHLTLTHSADYLARTSSLWSSKLTSIYLSSGLASIFFHIIKTHSQ